MKLSNRLESLPPYIFSQINQFKADAVREGKSLLSLGIGDPDLPTPPMIIQKIQEASAKASNHGYSPYEGSLAVRRAASQWMQDRFGVSVNPDREVIAVIGTKEAIAHFPVAFCNPGDTCLYPSPGYPVFSTSILLAGGKAIPVPARFENDLLPDLNEVESLLSKHRPRYWIINYPANPTSATITLEALRDIVQLARRYSTILVSDCAYSEIYYDEAHPPPSVLQVEGAKDIAIELHSMSKSFNMTGWRLGFAVGNEQLVQGLLKAKTNIDSGPLLAVQEAAIYALANADQFLPKLRETYLARREILLSGLDTLGIEYFPCNATFFVWARTPNQMKSMDLCKELITHSGLVVTPGIGFGPEGEYYFRMALTVDTPQIHQSLNLLESYLKRQSLSHVIKSTRPGFSNEVVSPEIDLPTA